MKCAKWACRGKRWNPPVEVRRQTGEQHSAGQEKRRSETARQARVAERRAGVAREMQVELEVKEKVKVWINDVAEAVPVPVKMSVEQGR